MSIIATGMAERKALEDGQPGGYLCLRHSRVDWRKNGGRIAAGYSSEGKGLGRRMPMGRKIAERTWIHGVLETSFGRKECEYRDNRWRKSEVSSYLVERRRELVSRCPLSNAT